MGEAQKLHSCYHLHSSAQTSVIWPCLTMKDSGMQWDQVHGTNHPGFATVRPIPGHKAHTCLLVACCFHVFLVIFKCVVITGFKNLYVGILGSLG